jgi:ribosome-associated heat shock protein Hsp15
MRVDKWLWTSRLVKTRALAAEAVKGGRVHLNGHAVKPSKEVAVGDEIRLTIGTVRRTVVIDGMAERRVSAPEATALYTETPASVEAREAQAEQRRLTAPQPVKGPRPTKRDRRRYERGRR